MLHVSAEFLVDEVIPEIPTPTSVCAVTLVVPKASLVPPKRSDAEWHRSLHQAYETGFTRIGNPDQVDSFLALGKIRSIDRSNPRDVRVDHWWWLVRLPGRPNTWVRGQLDEGCLHLDGRIDSPDTTAASPRGCLGPWPIQFFWGLTGGWQYKYVGDCIHQANSCLPPELQIRTDWECCDDPSRLINFYM